jgi:hypothetical protein
MSKKDYYDNSFFDDELNKDQDNEFYKSQKEYLRRKLKAEKEARMQREIERFKKKEKQQEFRQRIFSRVLAFSSKLIEPTTIVSAMTALAIYRNSVINQRQLESNLKEKETQIERLKTEYEAYQQKPAYRRLWENNPIRIITTTGTVLVPVGRHFYNNYQTNHQLKETQSALASTRQELVVVSDTLTEKIN